MARRRVLPKPVKKQLKKTFKTVNRSLPEPLQMDSLLRNRVVLYASVILALINVLKYIYKEEFEFLFLFVILALVSCNFSKNMIINMLVAIIGTNLVYLVSHNKNVQLQTLFMKEGMTDGADKPAAGAESAEKPKDDKKSLSEDPQCHKWTGSAWDLYKTVTGEDITDEACQAKAGAEEDVCWGNQAHCAKSKSAFTQMNIPKSEPSSLDNKRVDIKSTLSQTYGDLEKAIGNGGIQRLSEDTKNLMTQQRDLVKSLSEMGPVLKESKAMMDKLPIDDMTSLLDKISVK